MIFYLLFILMVKMITRVIQPFMMPLKDELDAFKHMKAA